VSRDGLIVEADPARRARLAGLLDQSGYSVLAVGSISEALAALAEPRFLFSLVNLDLEGGDGVALLAQLKRRRKGGAVIVMFDPGEAPRVQEAAATGADAFIQAPCDPEELRRLVGQLGLPPQRTRGRRQLEDPVAKLKAEIGLWGSPRMREVSRIVELAAQADVTVLITGETGTGKDLVARAIHYLSARHAGPFVNVHCAAVPRELLESELFGQERGAFTGAHQAKIGKFEAANQGTIVLDEIGDLHPALQAKLLHVLQDGEVLRVGGTSTIKVDVRIIAATNQDLEGAVGAGRFREDVYYRLNVIHIAVPALRERTEEIPLLIEHFVKRYASLYGREGFSIPADTMDRLVRHEYKGNIRELENLIRRMIVLDDPLCSRVSVPPGKTDTGREGRGPNVSAPRSLRQIAREAALTAERETIARVLEETRWNRVKAARLLNISYRALLYKIRDAGLARSPE
jgi:two-component system response regulator AtoC